MVLRTPYDLGCILQNVQSMFALASLMTFRDINSILLKSVLADWFTFISVSKVVDAKRFSLVEKGDWTAA